MSSNTPGYSSRRLGSLALTAGLILTLVAAVFLAGCGGGSTPSSAETTEAASPETTAADSQAATETSYPLTVTDSTGAEVTIPAKPERIVSTAPANTETLFAVGAGDRVVGVTSLADYPPEATKVEKIGDFQPSAEKILALQPDLVVAYSGNEDTLQPVIDAGIPVLIMNPGSVDEVYQAIDLVGQAVGNEQEAQDLVTNLQAQIEGIAATAKESGEKPSVFYALDNTLWTAGPGSFVDELLQLANAENVAAGGPSDYFQYTPEQLIAADPDIILLPGSIYTDVTEFTEDPRFAELSAVKNGNVKIIDDVVVTRPGPRLDEGLTILAKAIHPDSF